MEVERVRGCEKPMKSSPSDVHTSLRSSVVGSQNQEEKEEEK